MTCSLCGNAGPDLVRVSGCDFCGPCRVADPTEKLRGHDIASEWNVAMRRFFAGIGMADQDPDFRFKAVPELWYHKLWKLVRPDFQVGDAEVDDRLWLSTNQPETARAILAIDGVRSALFALLSEVRVNEFIGNHVTLVGPTMTLSTRPLGGLSDSRLQELKLEVAALALHLRNRRRP